MIAPRSERPNVAIVAGVRTPMARAGTALARTAVTDLARMSMQETLYRAGWPADRLDEVILGNVAMPADAANPARVAALAADVPERVPAMTVQRNCASGLEAIAEAAERIWTGRARVVLAGGAESMSTIPLLLPTEALGPAMKWAKARNVGQKLAALAAVRPRHLRPRAGLELGLTDPSCGMIMGQTAEVLAHEFHISREDQDAYALRSHQRAQAAVEAGVFEEQIVPMYVGEMFEPVVQDVGPRANQSLEALAKLKPVFDRRDGSVTVGNACQVTDGAATLLVMDEASAEQAQQPVLGYMLGYETIGLDPRRMGLGPAYAIHRLLESRGLALDDIGLFEINEAFAAQVLACLKAMASDTFAHEQLGRDKPLGEIDPDRLNVHGGAIALGHPVGASGARLVLNLLLEMRRRDVELGVAALCVGGGQGAAMLLQRR